MLDFGENFSIRVVVGPFLPEKIGRRKPVILTNPSLTLLVVAAAVAAAVVAVAAAVTAAVIATSCCYLCCS